MDEADKADRLIQLRESDALAAARKAVSEMPKGEPGECELCGEWSERLVCSACARCRDRYKLK